MYPQSYWNYRIVKYETDEGEPYYSVHECYYRDKELVSYTANPILVGYTSLEELRQEVELLLDTIAETEKGKYKVIDSKDLPAANETY